MSERKRASSASASSRYGHAELAGLRQDRVVDVGDVAHHAHLVAELLEPADQEVVGEVGGGVAEVRGVVRRDAAHVHAHDAAGSNGTTARCAVSKSRIVMRCGRSDAVEPETCASPLCRMLTVSSTAANVSMPSAFASEPASKARRSGMPSIRSSTSRCGPRRRRRDDDVAVERRGRGRRARPPGRGGTRPRPGRRARRLHPSATIDPPAGAPGRTRGRRFSRPFAIETTILPASSAAWSRRSARRRPTRWRARRARRLGRVGVRAAPSRRRDPVTPRSRSSSTTAVGRAAVARAQHARRARRGQPRREPLPCGPRPPQHPDPHPESFARPTIPRICHAPTCSLRSRQPARHGARLRGSQAMQSAPRRTRSSAKRPLPASTRWSSPRRSTVVFSGLSRCTNTGLSPGCSARMSLSLPTLASDSAAELDLHPHRRAAVEHELGPGDLHRDDLRACRRARRDGPSPRRWRRPRAGGRNSAIVFGNTITSSAAPRSSSTNVAMRSPRFVYLRSSEVTMPPTVRISPSRRLAQLGERAVDVAPQRCARRPSSGARSRRGRASPSRTRAAATSGTRCRGSRRRCADDRLGACVADRGEEVELAFGLVAATAEHGRRRSSRTRTPGPDAGGRASRTRPP